MLIARYQPLAKFLNLLFSCDSRGRLICCEGKIFFKLKLKRKRKLRIVQDFLLKFSQKSKFYLNLKYFSVYHGRTPISFRATFSF